MAWFLDQVRRSTRTNRPKFGSSWAGFAQRLLEGGAYILNQFLIWQMRLYMRDESTANINHSNSMNNKLIRFISVWNALLGWTATFACWVPCSRVSERWWVQSTCTRLSTDNCKFPSLFLSIVTSMLSTLDPIRLVWMVSSRRRGIPEETQEMAEGRSSKEKAKGKG